MSSPTLPDPDEQLDQEEKESTPPEPKGPGSDEGELVPGEKEND